MNLGGKSKGHGVARRAFTRSLSPKAVLALQSVVEASLGKRVRRWEEFAASGKASSLWHSIANYDSRSSVPHLGLLGFKNILELFRRSFETITTQATGCDQNKIVYWF